MSTPFKKSFFVDPTYIGVENGSEDTPFSLIMSAVAASPPEGALITVPVDQLISENLILPQSGDWHIFCPSRTTTLAGSIVCNNNNGLQGRYRFTNLLLNGPISGESSFAGGSQLILEGSLASAPIAMTKTGPGAWFANLRGNGTPNFSFGGGCHDLTVDEIFAVNWSFLGNLDIASPSVLTGCRMQGALSVNMRAGAGLALQECLQAGKLTITGTGINSPVQMDGVSMASAVASGLVTSGVNLVNLESTPGHITAHNNTAPIPIGSAFAPYGSYEASGLADLLVQGNSGLAVLNIHYVDALGTPRIRPITSGLDISLTAGAEDFKSVLFFHKGGQLYYSLTGISDPGLVSIAATAVVKRID